MRGGTTNFNGGVLCGTNMIVLIEDCHFKDCYAYNLGGACFVNGTGNFRVINSTFTNCKVNPGDGTGGACEVRVPSSFFELCLFDRCEANEGGGLHLHNVIGMFRFCTFARCKAVTTQGAGGLSVFNKTGYINDTSFLSCESFNSSNGGGGLRVENSDYDLVNTSFLNCYSDGRGSAIGCSAYGGTSHKLKNCTFGSNVCNNGATVDVLSGLFYCINCSFLHNRGTTSGGVHFFIGKDNNTVSSNYKFKNVIFLQNSCLCSSGGGGVYIQRTGTGFFTNNVFYLNGDNCLNGNDIRSSDPLIPDNFVNCRSDSTSGKVFFFFYTFYSLSLGICR
jgi:hypothetical protein